MQELARFVWESKYRQPGEKGIEDSWWRVARALASIEPHDQPGWAERFYEILAGFHFLPGGRILAGAGTARRVTLCNCFVMGLIEDEMAAIFEHLKEGALTLQQGGGIGLDFSTLRPAGSAGGACGTVASGPISFMKVWDAMCATLQSTGSRRGAMMATLRCDHPDILAFIDAKRDPAALRHFNLSVQVTDAFMAALAEGADWPLRFPAQGEELVRLPARELWQRLMQACYDSAEPGVLFIDRINSEDNLRYCEAISATNPCGEIPLPPYGACDLGSLNLTAFIQTPFGPQAHLDWPALEKAVALAVRMLDDVIDLSHYPLPAQEAQAKASRRIGLGVTGLGDVLLMLGLRYDSEAARDWAAALLRRIRDAAYQASIDLAAEKGPFPLFEAGPYLASPFVARLPEALKAGIAKQGIRNSHLLAMAPTGSISLLAGNLSSGIEPVFDFHHRRQVLTPGGGICFEVEDWAHALWRQGGAKALPGHFVTARQLSPRAHLAMVAALQPFVDNSISKTVNIPADYPFADFAALYQDAYRLGLKGCTCFRPNAVTSAVLSTDSEPCCQLEAP
ncbi:adenosylcobalamin-dependent ribonucleoside-diphosphate reductase [Gallaecimonas kandeliae]|uniref:adenosylcobalamin-dependent ribonucleoside-diphosphate reductase n=1 Tax=Gallaecimonas kandeliae TaxID=3029055 RepID=UPI002648E7F5|nr:adenosylcobalamin-dependent ribonucleoside-diphosphate reductase [Gallaecimonas kandeliae]WKE64225.1 adenosylcobalamin-dependent ribonucleoside-diphosphate reductase [Gallaecimonas kandeliae]